METMTRIHQSLTISSVFFKLVTSEYIQKPYIMAHVFVLEYLDANVHSGDMRW